MIQKLLSLGWVVALLACAAAVYKVSDAVSRAQEAEKALAQARAQFDDLAQQYNQAIRKTAVTELWVEQGQLSVVVRTAAGVEQRIATPYDPAGEVYVDYVVVDGRMWIRRVFDANTPPSQATVIDPQWEQIDWSNPAATLGKAVYRTLDEGRWTITVTGDGSLGLAKASTPSQDTQLTYAPPLGSFEPVE